jgi:hypothetical protein
MAFFAQGSCEHPMPMAFGAFITPAMNDQNSLHNFSN